MPEPTPTRPPLRAAPFVFPLLFGLYPVLHIFAANADRMAARYIVLPAALSIAATLAVLLVLRWLGRDGARAAVATAWIALVFTSYGRIWSVAGRLPALGDHRILWPLVVAVGLLGVWAVLRSRRDLNGWVAPLNVFALAFTAITLTPILSLASRRTPLPPIVRLTPPAQAPDVYYIILDGYGRESVLQRYDGFDNRPFLSALERRGFVVPRHSRANYLFTIMSLTTSLNMEDLDALRPTAEPDTPHWLKSLLPLYDLIESNRVARSFKAAGYRYVVLPSGLSFTNTSRIADVDEGASPRLREFDLAFGSSTLLAPWTGEAGGLVTPEGLENVERRLLACPSVPGPKFVFAHFLSPHPPYQFKADGSPADKAPSGVRQEWSTRKAYVEQVRYLNAFVLRAVDALVKGSKVPPIIIIQGDHGPALRDETETQSSMEPQDDAFLDARSGNLSAYLVPPAVRPKFPDDIRPINAFRFLFREVFGAETPLRANRSYYSKLDSPYRFVPISEASMDGERVK